MDYDRPKQLRPGDTILERFGDWAITADSDGARYVAHIGHPDGYPPVEYDIDFERLSENWERQLGEKTWMSDSSRADLARALTAARAL